MSNLVGFCSEMLQALGDFQIPSKTNFYKENMGGFLSLERATHMLTNLQTVCKQQGYLWQRTYVHAHPHVLSLQVLYSLQSA